VSVPGFIRTIPAWFAIVALLLPGQTRAAEVMILGTWHMAGPGHDLHNVRADDVLLPKRQRELAAVAEALARFRPTKVAVESLAGGIAPVKVEKYKDYSEGNLPASHNEVVQIGFRVANSAGLADVWGIDVEAALPYEPVKHFAQRHGAPYSDHLDALNASIERQLDGLNRVLRTGTIADALRWLNDPARIDQHAAFYTGMQQFSDAVDHPGPDLVAAWQQRNDAICARLVKLVRRQDRVIVVYGSGHAYLLRQCVRDAGFELVEAPAYLPK
jgi:hypothetical protein